MCHFRPVFANINQVKHFCEYVTGLIAGDRATIQAINDLFLNRNDQSALNKFMTRASWDEMDLNRRRVRYELERLHRRPVSAEAGRLIIDDTLAHHTKCSIEGLAYLRDHTMGRNVWAHNVITSYYVNRRDQFPVDFRLYLQFNRRYEAAQLQQQAAKLQAAGDLNAYRQYLTTLLSYHYRQQAYRPKAALAAELVQQAIGWELPFSVVLFDSWFLRWTLVSTLNRLQLDWVGGCPKNRNVLVNGRWCQLQDYIRTIPAEAYRPYRIGNHLFWAFTKVLAMKNLQRQKVRVVATYEDHIQLSKTPDFYATNRKDWEPKRILTTYLDRWPTETFNQDAAKGNLGFEAYQLQNIQGIQRHWYLSFLAYSLLGDQGHPGRSRWAVRGQFQSTGQRCQAVVDELLGDLVRWIVQHLRQGETPDHILHTLLA
ncbi:MAG: IS701 family transposase [Anaerolineales bacterium]